MARFSFAVLLAAVTVISGEPQHRHRHVSHLFQPTEYVNPYTEESSIFEGSEVSADQGDFAEYTVIEHEFYNELKGDKCSDLTCGAGRECVISEGGRETCVCADPNSCAAGHKLVCGSDGNLYESHCSLHRTACIKGQKIFVDRGGEACFQRDLLLQAIEKSRNSENEESVLSKKKDLSQTKYVNDEQQTELPQEKNRCLMTQFNEFKHLLKIYHCNGLGIANCDNQESSANRALVYKIYQYYDRDEDGLLTREELNYAQHADNLEKLAQICSLEDFLLYSPRPSGENYIDFNTFSLEFGIAGEERVVYEGNTKVIYVKSDGYSGISIPCGVANSSDCLWLRNGVELDFDNANGISLLADGTLYITAVNLDHTGNYTCYNLLHPALQQSQLLIVQVKPTVRSNEVGKVMEGVTTTLKCHSDGVPEPSVHWQISQYNLPDDNKRYYWENEKTSVNILSPQATLDSAQYQCAAKSSAGWSFADTDIKVLPKDEYEKVKGNKPSKGLYLVFHGSGYTVYEGEHCYTTHSINKRADDFVRNLEDATSTLGQLCPPNRDCDWSSAVIVKDKYVYASQPSLSRIIVIDVMNGFLPKHVLIVEHGVQSLHYMPSTDSLWMLLGNQLQFQTIMTASDVSNIEQLQVQHFVSHPTVFDSVDELFIPKRSAFNRTSRYAYASHYDQHGLSRLDTVTMEYDAKLTLSNWKCQPIHLYHLAIGGLAIVECAKGDTNLIIDTINNVVAQKFTAGSVHVSPNTRYIVTVNSPDKATVHYLHDNATISTLYHHTVQMAIDQIRFMESKYSSGYDLAITSPDENAVLFLDLKTTKTEMLDGLLSGRTNTTASIFTAPMVTSGGEFYEHLMVPSRGAVFVINKKYHMIACEWTDINSYQLSLWVDV